MKIRALAAALALLTLAPVQAAEVVATVNGQPLTQAQLDTYAAQQGGRESDPKRTLAGLVNQEIAYQEAERLKLADDPGIKTTLDLQRRGLLAAALVQRHLDAHPVTETEVREIYDQQVVAHKREEFKARHILLPDEAAAKAVIAELDKGGSFVELAKSKSTGPSKKDGGDLGWFQPEQMVKPFADAVVALKKGSYTKSPVQTSFGWHVILLEDRRDLEPPAFDSLKDKIQSLLENQRIRDYLGELSAKAKVEIK